MRLTARPPWVAGSARNAKTASWHSPSLMLGVPCGAVVHLMGWSRREPCPRNRSVAHAMLLPIPAPDRGRHDAITARAQAHPAQSRLLEGIPVGLGPARLRGVI